MIPPPCATAVIVNSFCTGGFTCRFSIAVRTAVAAVSASAWFASGLSSTLCARSIASFNAFTDSSVKLSEFSSFCAASARTAFSASLFTSGTAGFSVRLLVASSTAFVAASTLSCVAFSSATTFSASATASFSAFTDSSVYLSSSFNASFAVLIAAFSASLFTTTGAFSSTNVMSNLSSCGAFFSGAVNTSVPSPASLTTNSMSCVCVACAPSPAPTFTTSVCAAILLSFSAHVSPLLVSPLRNCTVALYFPGFSA